MSARWTEITCNEGGHDNTIHLLCPGVAATLCYIVHIIIIFGELMAVILALPKSRKIFNEQKKMRSNSQYNFACGYTSPLQVRPSSTSRFLG